MVDGRQAELSIGMTIQELAAAMHSLTCIYSLNLDDGSRLLYYEGQIKNSPFKTKEQGKIGPAIDENPIKRCDPHSSKGKKL